MNATTPMEKVAAFLEEAHFLRIATPLHLAGIEFDIPAAFIGTDKSSDLILLVDTAFENQQRIQQKVEGVARALDLLGSKRPLTTVLAGPRPRSTVIDAMSRICRVLPVGVPGSTDQDADIKNWLAVLLPLVVPNPTEAKEESVACLAPSNASDAITLALIEASMGNAADVTLCLNKLISEPIDEQISGSVL